MSQARDRYDEAADLAALDSKDPALRLKQAEAARALVAALIGERKAGDACDIYEDISELADGHPREAQLAAEQARIALALVEACGNRDIARDLRSAVKLAQVLLDDLAGLVKRFPDEPARRDEWARAAGRLAGYHRELKEPVPAEKLYKNVARLSISYPKEEGLRAAIGLAGMQASIAHAEAGNRTRAQALHDELARLAKAHAKDPVLRDYVQAIEEALAAARPDKA